jgi:hypothetical protein
MTSRLVLNLRESSYADIVVYSDDEHQTVDIVMSDIIVRQLEELNGEHN